MSEDIFGHTGRVRDEIERILGSSGTTQERLARPQRMVDLIASNPLGKLAVESGFMQDPSRNFRQSFARHCLEFNAFDVLKAVVEQKPAGVSYESTQTYELPNSKDVAKDWVGDTKCLDKWFVDFVADRFDPELLTFALKHEKSLDQSKVNIKESRSRASGNCHYRLLLKLAEGGVDADMRERISLCCHAFIDADYRCYVHQSSKGAVARGLFMFLSSPWGTHGHQLICPLLDRYIAEGWLDIDGDIASEPRGMPPLWSAVISGNAYAVSELIDRGCDIQKAIRYGETKSNPVYGLDGMLGLSPNSETVAHFNMAVMRNNLKVLTNQAGETSAELPSQRQRARL